jgi:beta-glucuronidase
MPSLNKQPRRHFLKQFGLAGASAALASPTTGSATVNEVASPTELATAVIPLENWAFTLDPGGVGEAQGWFKPAQTKPGKTSQVTVPHTWQIVGETADYAGAAWYWAEFDTRSHWESQWVRVEFEAAFHSARVWLNGTLLGDHWRDGYNAFVLDASPALRFDGPNLLAVQVDNSFADDMLPRNDSYDWAQDGGLVRPVNLLVSPRVFINHVGVIAEPDLDSGNTAISVWAGVRYCGVERQQLTFSYSLAEEGGGVALATVPKAGEMSVDRSGDGTVRLAPINLPLKLWHFDHPHLYRATVTMMTGGQPLHTVSTVFGSRKFEVKGTAFYLNGEHVRLMGVERMAGSNPAFGMAEPLSWIEHDHQDLKELNCVFTRVHWQQDKRVLDYCDRHGILVQEEIPAWGGDTFKGMANEPSPQIVTSGLLQLREMLRRDGNHPSIVAWGLCNEVNGHNPVSKEFIQRMAAEARRLDPHRLLTYASNSLQRTPGEDAAGLLDFIEWNEYYESWYPGDTDSVRRNLQLIHQAFPDKPVVISEYGYCECAPGRLGGDARRTEILRKHTQGCREFDFVAGTIFFDYNDYRTHMGDKGMGALKQRVHGVVDLYGNRKPSFEALREEASPVESLRVEAAGGSLSAVVATRQTLPAYTLEGYTLRWIVFGFDDLPVETGSAPLPKLTPGQQTTVRIEYRTKQPTRVQVDVLRPTGFSAITAWWKNIP